MEGYNTRLSRLESRLDRPKPRLYEIISEDREKQREHRLQELNDAIISETKKEVDVSPKNFIAVTRAVMRYVDKYAPSVMALTGYALTGSMKYQYALSILSELLVDITTDVIGYTIEDVYEREFLLKKEGHYDQHEVVEKALNKKRFSLRKRIASSLNLSWNW